MGIIELCIMIAIIGVVVWAITTYLPMDAKFKTLIIVIACVVCGLVALRALGFWQYDIPANQLGRPN